MGGSGSGRFQKGIKKSKSKLDLGFKKIIKKPVKKEPIVENQKPLQTIELAPETTDFESQAKRIAEESQNLLKAENQKNKTLDPQKLEGISETKTENKPLMPTKEDWTPVAGMMMHILGEVFEATSGFKEMNYTNEEIETCAPAVSEIFNVFFPDVQALTAEQQILLVNSAILLNVHVRKIRLLVDLKKEKTAEVVVNAKPNTDAEPTAH